MAYKPEPPFTHGTPLSTGVLLINLGTPDEPTPAAVRRYLKQFLSDTRVVEIPKAIWWIILNLIILNVRPAKSAKNTQPSGRKKARLYAFTPLGKRRCCAASSAKKSKAL